MRLLRHHYFCCHRYRKIGVHPVDFPGAGMEYKDPPRHLTLNKHKTQIERTLTEYRVKCHYRAVLGIRRLNFSNFLRVIGGEH